jgi:dCMP deaminase
MTERELAKHNIFLEVSHNISKLSTCASRQIGVVYVKEGRILSTGYNGVPSGTTHCNEIFDINDPAYDRVKHTEWSSCHEIHAEMNGIIFAARNGINLEGSTVYCTVSPCRDCAKNLINLNIKKIYFREYYDGINVNNEDLKKYLKQNNVELIQIKKPL